MKSLLWWTLLGLWETKKSSASTRTAEVVAACFLAVAGDHYMQFLPPLLLCGTMNHGTRILEVLAARTPSVQPRQNEPHPCAKRNHQLLRARKTHCQPEQTQSVCSISPLGELPRKGIDCPYAPRN